MSRTKKKKIESPQPWRTASAHKLTPYVDDNHMGYSKFTTSQERDRWGNPIKITATAKLITKNANRSLKKGLRQKAKKEISEQLNGTNE